MYKHIKSVLVHGQDGGSLMKHAVCVAFPERFEVHLVHMSAAYIGYNNTVGGYNS